MVTCLEWTVILAIAVLAYAWLLYPLALLCLPARRGAAPATDAPPPEAAVLVAAHNEEAHIARRLADVQRQTAGGRIREILVGVDGSDDRTAALARAAAEGDARIRVIEFAARRGKPAVLKELASRTSAGALVFTDANTAFRADAVERLLNHFSDPRIGGVAGRLLLVADDAAAERRSEEGTYWDWEARLKARESGLDSCLGANGAIYAIRRGLFWRDMPDNTVVDDFVLGMKVREAGYRMQYDASALAEETLPALAHEWARRVRIGAGDYQALRLCRACLHPRFGAFAWMFWSHKVLRWFTPHLLLSACGAALLLAALDPAPGRAVVPLGFAAVLLAGAAGRRAKRRGGLPFRLLRLCGHFLAMNAALFAGWLLYLRGGLQGHWARTPR